MSHVLKSLHAKCDILGRLFWTEKSKWKEIIIHYSNFNNQHLNILVAAKGVLGNMIKITIKIMIMITIIFY